MNVDRIMNNLEKKHPGEVEYLQAVREVLESIEEVYNENPQFESANIIERIIEPDRAVTFKVPWVDDEGNVRVNLGYRIPVSYTHLRAHETVLDIVCRLLLEKK